STAVCRVQPLLSSYLSFFHTPPSPPHIYTLSLHDALPISRVGAVRLRARRVHRRRRGQGGAVRAGERWYAAAGRDRRAAAAAARSEEHTSELQSPCNLVCRLLLEKKKKVILRRMFMDIFTY